MRMHAMQVACGISFSVALFSNQGSLEVRTTGEFELANASLQPG